MLLETGEWTVKYHDFDEVRVDVEIIDPTSALR